MPPSQGWMSLGGSRRSPRDATFFIPLSPFPTRRFLSLLIPSPGGVGPICAVTILFQRCCFLASVLDGFHHGALAHFLKRRGDPPGYLTYVLPGNKACITRLGVPALGAVHPTASSVGCPPECSSVCIVKTSAQEPAFSSSSVPAFPARVPVHVH